MRRYRLDTYNVVATSLDLSHSFSVSPSLVLVDGDIFFAVCLAFLSVDRFDFVTFLPFFVAILVV
jgi:hypothetical protein